MSTYSRETEGLTLVHKFADQVKGRTFLLTGPSPRGIGAETLISLAAESPALLILVGRSQEKAQATIDAIKKVNSVVKIKFIEADLTSLESVRQAARTILDDASIAQIDVVINNAAVMATPFELTPDGFELQLAASHLGHFVLTNKILPKVLAAGPGARLVMLTSSGHRYAGVRFSDPNFAEPGSYSPYDAYGQAKSAVILYAVALNKRLGSRGVRAYAAHPGSVQTNLQDYVKKIPEAELLPMMEDASQRVMGISIAEYRRTEPWLTLQQGCATTLRAALDPDLVTQEGVYLQNSDLTTDTRWIKEWATDPELAEKMWALSEELVGEKGKTRLAKWYVPYSDEEKIKLKGEVHRLVAPRDQKYQSNFVEFRNYKIVYRRYAGLFFCACVDTNDNELAYLEAIHFFVEVLDAFFGNVCELDLVFNFYKVYAILDEVFLAGEIEETSKQVVLTRLEHLDKLE
ncbi:clathrin adaptor complex small chain-domain-containing protein [Annulohypoxylon bovei var. microspora]|nr:clathrin adaptor complex small chain-domain-containing protein [Annulohypoxylon bovei var. microspora]